jgi:hypothetical protein
MPDYTLVQGDCISSLALEHGLLPETIWQHPQNAALRHKRRDPNVLLPGDVLFIPEKVLKEVSRPTGRRHTFVRLGVPARLKLRLLRNDKPRANKHYILEIDGRLLTGHTDQDGWLVQAIPPNARGGMLTLVDTGEQIPVHLGYLDPIDELAGVQERLRNLGYYSGPITNALDEETQRALSAFQRQQQLPLTGRVDAATQQALQAAHRS